MKTTKRRQRQPEVEEQPVATTPPTIFSSDLLTPEEERELLADFWENKSELVRVLIRHFSRLRQHRPPLEPWPMAQFIRDHCNDEARAVAAVRRLHDPYTHLQQPRTPHPPPDRDAHARLAQRRPRRRQRLQADRSDAGQREHDVAPALGAPGSAVVFDGELAAARAQGARPALRADRQRHPQP